MVTSGPPVPWSQIKAAITPAFTDVADTMLTRVAPVTGTLEGKSLESFNAQANLALPTVALSTARQTSTDAQGNVTTTINAQETKTNGTVPAQASAPPAPPVQAGALPPSASVLSASPGIDPMMQYTAANALFQQVAVLDHYFSALDSDWNGYAAYVMSFHIAVSPARRNLPYDTYVDITVDGNAQGPVPAGNSGAPPEQKPDAGAANPSPGGQKTAPPPAVLTETPVKVIPLIATDSLESLLQSHSAESAVALALGIQGAIAQLPINASVGNIEQKLNTLIGRGYNSTLLVGREGDATVRVRLGAILDARSEKESYVMTPMSHDISVIVLVPENVKSLTVFAVRRFQHSMTGVSPPNLPVQKIYQQVEDMLFQSLQESLASSPPDDESGPKAGSGDAKAAAAAEPKPRWDGAYRRSFARAVKKINSQLLTSFNEGIFDAFQKGLGTLPSPTEKDQTLLAANAALMPVFASRAWAGYSQTRELSSLAVYRVDLGANEPGSLIPRPPAGKSVVLSLNGAHLQGTLGNGAHLEAFANISASLAFAIGTKELTLFADACTPMTAQAGQAAVGSPQSQQGNATFLNLAFPLPASFDLAALEGYLQADPSRQLSGSLTLNLDNQSRVYPAEIGDLSEIPGLGLALPPNSQLVLATVGPKGASIVLRGGQHLDLLRNPAAVLNVLDATQKVSQTLAADSITVSSDKTQLTAQFSKFDRSLVFAGSAQAAVPTNINFVLSPPFAPTASNTWTHLEFIDSPESAADGNKAPGVLTPLANHINLSDHTVSVSYKTTAACAILVTGATVQSVTFNGTGSNSNVVNSNQFPIAENSEGIMTLVCSNLSSAEPLTFSVTTKPPPGKAPATAPAAPETKSITVVAEKDK